MIGRQSMALSRSARAFSTSAVRADLFDFLKRRSIKPAEPKVPLKSTKEVMKSVESGEADAASQEKKVLRVIGGPQRDNRWSEESKKFSFRAWPVKYVDPSLTEETVLNALKTEYHKVIAPEAPSDWLSTPLTDLRQRFEYTKQIQLALRVSIPDSVLSTLLTVGDIKEYYVRKVSGVELNEKEPDAVYLTQEQFNDLGNVRVVDVAEERQARQDRWKQAVREAKEAEKKKADELLKSAMEQ
ncbi:large ribosomal subunit protein mL50 [Trichomonascus vanleenenianus]|uniref:mitochondrial 54S ribosomal protein mL50 MRPL13 n=1 Tax=Trichomonascus vanleenenianus TaxID=2268995 RepID=UPI003ECAB4DC